MDANLLLSTTNSHFDGMVIVPGEIDLYNQLVISDLLPMAHPGFCRYDIDLKEELVTWPISKCI